MRWRFASLALLLLALPAYAVDTTLCDDDGITATPLGSRPGGGATCLEIDPGNGGAAIRFQYEEFDETTVGPGCENSTLSIKKGTSGGPKTHFWNNVVADNYRHQDCQNEDVMFVGGGGDGGGYDTEFTYIRDSKIINGWKCAGSAWTGTGSAAGLSCPAVKSKSHSDGIQLRGQPVNNGWWIMQGSEPGKSILSNGYNLQFLGQVDAYDGELGSIMFHGTQIGRINTPIGNAVHWVDDCYDRAASAPADMVGICEVGPFKIGNGPQLALFIDVWGSTLTGTSGDGGVPGLIVVVNTGCNKTGCTGTRGYTNGWPHPIARAGTGPGTCDGTTLNGRIGTAPLTYCFPSIESMIAGATAAGLDLDPYIAGEQHQPPMVDKSPIGWVDAPGAALRATVTLTPNPVEVGAAFTLGVDPAEGTAPYETTYDLDGDGSCDDGATDTTDPASEGGTAPGSPITRTLKACITDSATPTPASITREIPQTVIPNCGNGTIEAPEQCDTAALGGADCEDALGPGATGTLACSASCTFDASACTPAVSACGDAVCSLAEGESGPDGPDACFADCAAYTASFVCKGPEGWDYCGPDLTDLESGERFSLKDSPTREFAIFIEVDERWDDPNTGGINSMWLDHTGPPSEPSRDTRQNNPVYVFPGDTGPGGIQNTLPFTPTPLKGTHRFRMRPCSANMDGPTNAPTSANCTGGPGGVLGPELDVTVPFGWPAVVELGPPGKPFLWLSGGAAATPYLFIGPPN